MANITLSVPDWVRDLMKRYKEVNWSEVARRAIIREILRIKAVEEGLTIEELDILLDIVGAGEAVPSPLDEESLQAKIRERERRRIRRIEEVEG